MLVQSYNFRLWKSNIMFVSIIMHTPNIFPDFQRTRLICLLRHKPSLYHNYQILIKPITPSQLSNYAVLFDREILHHDKIIVRITDYLRAEVLNCFVATSIPISYAVFSTYFMFSL